MDPVINGTAICSAARVIAVNSIALGANSLADQIDTVSVGTAGGERRIVSVANATGATDAVNLGQIQAADTALQNQITQNSTDITT